MKVRKNIYIDDPENDIMGDCPHEISYLAPSSVDVDGIYIQVHRAGVVLKTPSDFHVGRDDSYPHNMIHCVFSGHGSVSSRGKVSTVERGQIFVLASNESHVYSSDPKDPMGLVWVEFCGGNSAQITKHILDLGGMVYGGGVFNHITDLCTSILYQPDQQNPKISAIIYEMLMCLCSHVETDTYKSPVDQNILRYIDDNIDHRLTLTDISAAFGYHPAYFSSRFAKNMGITYSKYVMHRKMNYACHYLETTNWSVDRIAQELGFCDISHFIQRFKTSEGITPSVYRNKLHQSPAEQNELEKQA